MYDGGLIPVYIAIKFAYESRERPKGKIGKERGQVTEKEIHLLLNMKRCSTCFIRKAKLQ